MYTIPLILRKGYQRYSTITRACSALLTARIVTIIPRIKDCKLEWQGVHSCQTRPVSQSLLCLWDGDFCGHSAAKHAHRQMSTRRPFAIVCPMISSNPMGFVCVEISKTIGRSTAVSALRCPRSVEGKNAVGWKQCACHVPYTRHLSYSCTRTLQASRK